MCPAHGRQSHADYRLALPLIAPDWAPSAPLQQVHLDWLDAAGIELAVLRLDLTDRLISGNKWFKLSGYLQQADAAGCTGVMSLGGAHSNHLHALASAGARFNFPTVGLLRGTECQTPTVADLKALGMQLHWLGYGGYRKRHEADFWVPWQQQYAHFQPVPEGGGGLLGARGCAPIIDLIREQLAAIGWADYDALWLGAGTGTTLAGLVMAETGAHPVYGAMAVPVTHGVQAQVTQLLAQAGLADSGYQLLDACRGGFAKVDSELVSFMRACEQQMNIPLEPLYTAKTLFALQQHVRAGLVAQGSRLIFIHTGGLQGRAAALAAFQ